MNKKIITNYGHKNFFLEQLLRLKNKSLLEKYKYIFIIFRKVPLRLRKKIFFQQFISSLSSAAEILSIGALIPIITFALDQNKKYNFPVIGSIDVTSITFLFILAVALSTFLRSYVVWNNLNIGAEIGSNISKQLFSNYIHQDLSYQRKNHSGKIISSLTYKVSNVTGVFSSILNINTSILSMLFVASAISFMNPTVVFTLVGIITSYYFLVSRFTRKKVREYGLRSLRSDKDKIKNIQEAFESYREITILSSQESFVDENFKYEYEQRSSWAKSNFLAALPKYGAELVLIIVIVAYLYILPERSITNIASLGAIIFGFQKIVPQAQQLFSSWATINSNVHVLEDVCEDLTMLERTNAIYAKVLTHFGHSIELSSIQFSHDHKSIFNDLNINILVGDKIGIIGKTGKGKSTLIDLICGFVKPQRGTISVDNEELTINDKQCLRAWMNNIALVQQKNYVTSSSILNNIVGNNPDVDYDKLSHILFVSQLTELIDSLPDGIHSNVGERGCLLSGGQIQRICIARALYLDRRILILDEATSALDSYTEKQILENIFSLYNSRTIILVTHKLGLLQMCNKILDLNNNPNSFQ